MEKVIGPIVFLAFSVFAAQSVSLSGKVTKAGGTTGISAVKVSLTNLKTISTTTDADGAFTMSGASAVRLSGQSSASFRFIIKDNCLHFTPISGKDIGSMALFSSDGKELFSIDLRGNPNKQRTISLPELKSGINILRISMGGVTYSYSLLSVGNQQFLINGSSTQAVGTKVALMKLNAVVDTLVASKSGYKTVKTPLDSYNKQDIAIQMDTSAVAPGGKCTRDALQELANGYIAALEAGDPTKMSLTSDAKYFEQFKASAMGKGIWTTKIKANLHREFLDTDSCKIFVEIVDNVSSVPHLIGTQLLVTDGKISNVSALVADTDDWSLKNAAAFTTVYTKSKAESWTLIPTDKQDTRQTIVNAGNAYLSLFAKPYKDTVPWGSPCARLEGSMYAQPCNAGIPQQDLPMTDRIFVVDLDMGTVDIFTKFGGSIPDSHMFRVEGGKLRYVHTITIMGKN
jgi:hypothetical protein